MSFSFPLATAQKVPMDFLRVVDCLKGKRTFKKVYFGGDQKMALKDTVKDIIQGTDSGGLAKSSGMNFGENETQNVVGGNSRRRPPLGHHSNRRLVHSMSGEELANHRRAFSQIQSQLDLLRRQQDELAIMNEQTRRRFETAQQMLHRRLETTEGAAVSIRELGDVRRLVAGFDSRINGFGSEMLALRTALERQAVEIRALGSDLRSRPTIEPARIATTTQAIENKIRELQIQMAQLKQNLDVEMGERAAQAEIINKMQELVRSREMGKADQLMAIGRRMEVERERMGQEMRRLAERIQIMGQQNSTERQKYKERFHRVNEALQTLEIHLESGHQKMDKVVGAELESRKLHERALLTKLQDVEGRLNNHVNELTKTMGEIRSGLAEIRIPVLDTEALRKDMEAIASDRNKLSMEGLLRLEERVTRMRHGLQKERRELHAGLEEAVDREVNAKLKVQLERLDDLVAEIERTQIVIRDRVEHQIPADLEEMEVKLENVKAQLVHRIDQEEEERYLAIKELQDAYGRLAAGGHFNGIGLTNEPVSSASLRRDVDECKVAIKKLAESLTTVKNVLDRKLMEEIRRREQDVEILNSRIDTATVQALQIQ